MDYKPVNNKRVNEKKILHDERCDFVELKDVERSRKTKKVKYAAYGRFK